MTNEQKRWALEEKLVAQLSKRGDFNEDSPEDLRWLCSLSTEEMERMLAE